MMSTYNMTIANPAMAPRGGMAGFPLPLDPPLHHYASRTVHGYNTKTIAITPTMPRKPGIVYSVY